MMGNQATSPAEVFASFTDNKGCGPDVFKLDTLHWPTPELAAALRNPDAARAFLVVLTLDDEPSGEPCASIMDSSLMLYPDSARELHRRLGEWLGIIDKASGQ